ncbi:MAG TPA: dihydrodipicolinate reductase [archaeon]|nr:dihydrodipicolinate reductase [archaeon]
MRLDKIKVVQYGLGPIGLRIVEFLLTRPWVELVGAVDIDRTKVGKDVGQLLASPKRTGILVGEKGADVLKQTSPDAVTHATSSSMNTIQPQLLEIVDNGVSVVSTAEELTYPFAKHPELANALDQRARKTKAVVLGTGINPGFLLDTLAVVLSGVCQKVNSIRAERIVDSSRRRLQLQKKTGAGMAPSEFEKKVAEGSIKHVGLPESVGLISLAMGWKVGEIQERITPVIAEKEVRSDQIRVQPGAVAGVRQVAKGILAGQELVVLDLRMYIGAPNPHDSILIDGTPPVDMTIRGGVHGDTATPAIIVNAIPKLMGLEPGLRTMLDVPPLSPRLDIPTEDRSVMLKTF